jgi:hypothetical protein
MLEKQVFEPVASGNHNTIPSTMFVKRKTTATGDFSKFTASERIQRAPSTPPLHRQAQSSPSSPSPRLRGDKSLQLTSMAPIFSLMDDEVYMPLSPSSRKASAASNRTISDSSTAKE